MTETYKIGTPTSSGDRNLYPIIRITNITCFCSFWISAAPVAILIEELGKWSFIAIEEGITEEIIHHIPIPERV